PITVDFATADGTATVADGDYQAASGTLVFAPGQTSKTVTVLVNGDTTNETNESFFLNISNPSNALIADGRGVGTVENDDGVPGIPINDVSVTEGDTGEVSAVFTVRLSAASGQTVTVDFATAAGTAAEGADYAAASGTLTFAPGETSRAVTVTVHGDTLSELDETFFLNLTGAANAFIADPRGVGTIADDDPLPTVSIGDVSAPEGSADTTAFV